MTALGIGTYAGAATPDVDSQYDNVLRWAFAHGCTLVDSSMAYRAGRSVACIARVLSGAESTARLCIKVGFDATSSGDGAAGHSLDRPFLEEQILRSVEAFGSRPIDWLLLHNPEVQLRQVERPRFESLLQTAFEMLEAFRSRGAIGGYGVATSRGFRVPPEHPMHINLDRLLTLAKEVSTSNGFRVLQAPLSIDAPEAASLFSRAKAMGLVTMGTSPITPFGSYERPVHPAVALAALKWALSMPAVDWIVCGTLNLAHLKANLGILAEVAASRQSGIHREEQHGVRII